MVAKSRGWQAQVKGPSESRVKTAKLSCSDVVTKLAAVGVKDDVWNISNKTGRGTFGVMFFVQCIESIGCKTSS
jgi:hypothetical protein